MSLTYKGSFGPIAGAIKTGNATPALPVITTPAVWTANNTGAGAIFSDYTISTGSSQGYAEAYNALVTTGKYYWEYRFDAIITGLPGYTRVGIGAGGTNVWQRFGGNNTPTWGPGDVISCALDVDAGFIHFGKNGTWENDPAGGAGTAYATGITGNLGPSYFEGSSAGRYTITLRSDPADLQYPELAPVGHILGIGLTS